MEFITAEPINIYGYAPEMASMIDKAKNFMKDKVASIKKPKVELTDVDLKGVGLHGADFKSQISVTNPYDHSIPICDITYSFKSADRLIASGRMPDPGSIKKNGVTVLDMYMKVPYGVLVNLAKDIGADWDIDYHLEVGFTIDLPILGNFTIPIDKKGTFKLPSLSDIF